MYDRERLCQFFMLSRKESVENLQNCSLLVKRDPQYPTNHHFGIEKVRIKKFINRNYEQNLVPVNPQSLQKSHLSLAEFSITSIASYYLPFTIARLDKKEEKFLLKAFPLRLYPFMMLTTQLLHCILGGIKEFKKKNSRDYQNQMPQPKAVIYDY